VITREADAREDLLRRLAEGLPEEMLRHQPSGGGGARPEGEGLAGDLFRQLLRGLQARLGVGDDVALEIDVLGALNDGPGAGHGPARLDAREAAEPGQLHLVVRERGDGRGVALDRNVLHRDAELRLEKLGHFREALYEPAFVLVRNGGEHESGLVLGARRSDEHRERHGGRRQR
jgi:hypothetical protein